MFVIVSLKDQNQGDYSFFAMLGLKRTWNKLEITKALCRPKADSRTALSSRIYIYISLFIQPYTQEES